MLREKEQLSTIRLVVLHERGSVQFVSWQVLVTSTTREEGNEQERKRRRRRRRSIYENWTTIAYWKEVAC